MPGDSFGADALVSGQRRNASVVMLSDGRVMCLPADDISLSGQRTAGALGRTRVPGAHVIDLSHACRAVPTRCARWRASWISAATYVFDGAAEGDRALAAFLATQRGVQRVCAARFEARLDLRAQAGTVRSFAHARSACTESARRTDIGYVRLIAPSTSSVVTVAWCEADR